MKRLSLALLICAPALSLLAQDAKTNTVTESNSTTNKILAPVMILPAAAGTISAPLELTHDCISQPETTDAGTGGKAIYNFTITNAGDYVIRAVVNAPAEDANSFYVNVDAPPEDPDMIWDIEVTDNFAERTVSWRGNGSGSSDEFDPKRFQLSAGPHKLYIVGREAAAELKSISIHPVSGH